MLGSELLRVSFNLNCFIFLWAYLPLVHCRCSAFLYALACSLVLYGLSAIERLLPLGSGYYLECSSLPHHVWSYLTCSTLCI